MDEKTRLEVKEIVNKTVTAKLLLFCAIIGPVFGAVVGIGSYAYGSDKEYNGKSIVSLNMKMDKVVDAVGEIKYIKEDVAFLKTAQTSMDERVKRLEMNPYKNIGDE